MLKNNNTALSPAPGAIATQTQAAAEGQSDSQGAQRTALTLQDAIHAVVQSGPGSSNVDRISTQRVATFMTTAKSSWTDDPMVAGFDGMDRFDLAIRSPKPAVVRRALLDLAQTLPYLNASQAAAALHDAIYVPKGAARGEGWVEGIFALGGNLEVVQDSLRAHAHSGAPGNTTEGNATSRAEATTLLAEIYRENQARQKAGSFASSTAPTSGSLPWSKLDSEDAFTMSPEALGKTMTEIAKASAELLEAGIIPAIATDLDGTTWSGDIGEELFDHAMHSNLFLPEAAEYLAAKCDRFGLPATGDANESAATLHRAYNDPEQRAQMGERSNLTGPEVTREYYEANVGAFAGRPVSWMKVEARKLFDQRGFDKKIFDGVVELLSNARSDGLIPYAISASNQWIVEVAAEYLGIPPWRCAGIQMEVHDGIVTPKTTGAFTYGEGKLDAFEELSGGRRPLFGMGDSTDATDKEMLHGSALALAVMANAKRKAYALEQAKAGKQWRELRYPH